MSETKYTIEILKIKHCDMYKYNVHNIDKRVVAKSKLWYPSRDFVIAEAVVAILAIEENDEKDMEPSEYYDGRRAHHIFVDDDRLGKWEKPFSEFSNKLPSKPM